MVSLNRYFGNGFLIRNTEISYLVGFLISNWSSQFKVPKNLFQTGDNMLFRNFLKWTVTGDFLKLCRRYYRNYNLLKWCYINLRSFSEFLNPMLPKLKVKLCSNPDNVCILHPSNRAQSNILDLDPRYSDRVLPRPHRTYPTNITGDTTNWKISPVHHVSRLRINPAISFNSQLLSEVRDWRRRFDVWTAWIHIIKWNAWNRWYIHDNEQKHAKCAWRGHVIRAILNKWTQFIYGVCNQNYVNKRRKRHGHVQCLKCMRRMWYTKDSRHEYVIHVI